VAFPAHSIPWDTQVTAGLIRADAPVSLPVHPLQLYFLVCSLALGLALLWFGRRRAYVGEVLLAYLVIDNLAKFVLELLRDPAIPHLRQMSLAICVMATGVLVLGRARRWGEEAAAMRPIRFETPTGPPGADRCSTS
jgi:phosphatidylglycerol:prolipoprotein diacylglycerol transferase